MRADAVAWGLGEMSDVLLMRRFNGTEGRALGWWVGLGGGQVCLS